MVPPLHIFIKVVDKTMVRKGGALASIEAFSVGAPVAVKPRGLPSGDLMAAIVADTPAEIATAVLDGQVNWEGTLAEVNAERGAFVLRRVDGATRPIAVAPTARLRRGRATLTLRDLAPGTAVKVHLLRGADANGLRTADAVSVIQPAATAK